MEDPAREAGERNTWNLGFKHMNQHEPPNRDLCPSLVMILWRVAVATVKEEDQAVDAEFLPLCSFSCSLRCFLKLKDLPQLGSEQVNVFW